MTLVINRIGSYIIKESMHTTISRRERKKKETRQRLLSAAMELFREQGYTATTVEDITDRADVAKGTFFNYFPSKEALLSELSIWGIEKLRTEIEVSNGAPSSPVARIKLLLGLLQEQVGGQMKLPRRAFAARLFHPPPAEQARRRLSGILTELVSEAQACGEIRAELDVMQVSKFLHMSFFWSMMTSQGEDCDQSPLVHFENIIDLWMDGIAGPQWSKEWDH
jgi:AcrR family transcriptional regulator